MTSVQKTLMGATREEVRARLGALERVDCPICKKDQARPFATDYYGMRIVRCRRCGLLYLNPRPAYSWLVENIYAEGYQEETPPGAAAVNEIQRAEFARQLAGIECYTNGRTLLDVGAGGGEFLAFAAGQGWKIFGTEVARSGVEALERALPQVKFYCGRLRELDFQGQRFDAIRLNHVLEHTQNPAEELGCMAKLLAQGGVIRIEVPNLASLDSRIKNMLSRLRLKRKRYRHFAALHHLWFFTPTTLRRLAESVGLRVASLEAQVYFRDGNNGMVARAQKALLEPLGMGNRLEAFLIR